MGLHALVFDLDGLMVDTEPLARRAWDEILRPLSHALDDNLYGRMVGRRTDESAELVQSALGLPLTAIELAGRKQEALARIRALGVPPMPGLMPLIAEIRRRGLPWAVATSSETDHAREILTQLGLWAACHALATGDDVAHAKPAPDLYLLAAGRLGISPEQCLALEDSVPGVQAALAAGMTVVAIPNGTTTPAEFPFAHTVMGSLIEVAERLDTLLA